MKEHDMLTVFLPNVKKWTEKLQDYHWEHGRTWYKQAHQLCQSLSDENNVPLKNVVGVLAALSPQVAWEVNVRSCEAIVREKVIDSGYTGYQVNVAKALQCLVSDPITVLGGAKVIAFYYNILDPKTSTEVTIDTHIGRILFDTMSLDEKQTRMLFSKKYNATAQKALPSITRADGIKDNPSYLSFMSSSRTIWQRT